MRILLLGGGVFLGRAVLDAALMRGHSVAVFNRGRSRRDWPAQVEVITGDRRADAALAATRGPWDAVIDHCGYCPADVLPTAAALSDCRRYLFVSSVSAYASTARPGTVESDPLAAADGLAADAAITGETYGPLKAECERVLARELGTKLLIVRPGLIVGPGDVSGRFSYWPWRAAAGGTMLVPAAPRDAPLQFIDVRDLAAWMIALVEQGASGAFNAIGPAGEGTTPVGWSELIAACRDAARALGFAPAQEEAVDEALLLREGVVPWTELPLWLPTTDPEYEGFNRVDASRAVAHGLRTRPLLETARGIIAEGLPPADDARRRGKLPAPRESALLALSRR